MTDETEETGTEPKTDPTEPKLSKSSWFWIKDSSGYPSVTVTFATVAFWVTTVLYILGAVKKIGPVEFQPFDVAGAGAYFIPILTLYFGRKWTDAKTGVTQQREIYSPYSPYSPSPSPYGPAPVNPRLYGDKK